MIDLGSRHISRSAYADSTGTETNIYLGVCEQHERPVRYEGTDVSLAYSGNGKYLINCPEGNHPIAAERLVAVTTRLTCDSSCMSARRAYCACGCGGINHGKSWGTTVTRQEYESALNSYRAEIKRNAEKREAKREAKERKARESFETWAAGNAELVAALESHLPDDLGYPREGSNDFLASLARQVHRQGKILSENQVTAGARTLRQLEKRATEKAAWAADAKPAPTGKGVRIEGEIIKVTAREGYSYNEIDYKMTVKCDGYAIWVSVPARLRDWATSERGDVIYSDERYRGYTDYEGISHRWTEALKGVKVQFTAEVSQSSKSESFGFAKRPTQVQFQAD